MNSQSPSIRVSARRWASVSSGLSRRPESHWNDLGDAWGYVAYILSGIAVWGGAGWLLDNVMGWYPVATLIGVMLGNVAGIYLIYIRSGAGRAS